MKVEVLGGLFFVPTDLFTNLENPESQRNYKRLIQLQHGFSDEEADEIVAHVIKKEYWRKKSEDVLPVVTNEDSDRAFQMGFLLGYDSARFYIVFPDTIIEIMEEEDVSFIEKSKISPELGIRVEFLDKYWQRVVQEGELVGYEKTEDRKGGEPYGAFVIETDGEVQKIKDWGFTTGGFRFVLRPPESET